MIRRIEYRRVITEVVTAGYNHCSNDCPFLNTRYYSTGQERFMGLCMLLSREVSADRRRKNDPYRRPKACKNIESI